MTDKVRLLFQRFDADSDGQLSYAELRTLQLATSGEEMDGPQFCAVCKALRCDARRGLTLKALRAVYESDDANIDDDYAKVFGDEVSSPESVMDAEFAKVFRELVATGGGAGKKEDDGAVLQAGTTNNGNDATIGQDDSNIVWLTVSESDSTRGEATIPHKEESKITAAPSTSITEVLRTALAIRIQAFVRRALLRKEYFHKRQAAIVAAATRRRAVQAPNATEKFRAIHRYFDANSDGLLNYAELRNLQLKTTGEDLDGPQYCNICREYDCDPKKGLSLANLKEIYASSGANVDEDYAKMLQDKELQDAKKEEERRDSSGRSGSFAANVRERLKSERGAKKDDGDKAQESSSRISCNGDVGDEVEGSYTSMNHNLSEDMEKKVCALHKHFDVDCDKRLDFVELRNLQLRTSDEDIGFQQFLIVCQLLDCDPRRGLAVDDLKMAYVREEANINEDYEKIFGEEAKLYDDRIKDESLSNVTAEVIEKARLVFEYFDADFDGRLSYNELRKLQLATCGEDMDGVQFSSVCQLFDCDARKGLTIGALLATYTAEGSDSNLDDDYCKVFRKFVGTQMEEEIEGKYFVRSSKSMKEKSAEYRTEEELDDELVRTSKTTVKEKSAECRTEEELEDESVGSSKTTEEEKSAEGRMVEELEDKFDTSSKTTKEEGKGAETPQKEKSAECKMEDKSEHKFEMSSETTKEEGENTECRMEEEGKSAECRMEGEVEDESVRNSKTLREEGKSAEYRMEGYGIWKDNSVKSSKTMKEGGKSADRRQEE